MGANGLLDRPTDFYDPAWSLSDMYGRIRNCEQHLLFDIVKFRFFSGVTVKSGINASTFENGFRVIMIFSGILSLIGSYTSLLRTKKLVKG